MQIQPRHIYFLVLVALVGLVFIAMILMERREHCVRAAARTRLRTDGDYLRALEIQGNELRAEIRRLASLYGTLQAEISVLSMRTEEDPAVRQQLAQKLAERSALAEEIRILRLRLDRHRKYEYEVRTQFSRKAARHTDASAN